MGNVPLTHMPQLFLLKIRPPPRSTLFSLHDALPISHHHDGPPRSRPSRGPPRAPSPCPRAAQRSAAEEPPARSEEHTSELQSRENLVCRLLLEKKKKMVLARPALVFNIPHGLHVHSR